MPFIRVTVADSALDAAGSLSLAQRIGEAIADKMGKNKDSTSVLVDNNPARIWSIGGERQKQAAVVEAFITRGTNHATEKARFIETVDAIIRSQFSTLHLATYVIVHEVTADAWGYGGQTQQSRAVARDTIVMSPAG